MPIYIDRALMPVVDWATRVAKSVALIGWAYWGLAMLSSHLCDADGPMCSQLVNTMNSDGGVLVSVLLALSVLLVAVKLFVKPRPSAGDVGSAVL